MRRVLIVLVGAAMSLTVSAGPVQSAKPQYGAWGVDLAGMDTSVKPGDDFFRYVNGTWLKTAVVPADRTRIGAFDDLSILSEQRMKALVAAIEAKPVAQLSPEEAQLRNLYDTFMDTAAIEAAGLAPAEQDLHAIASLATRDDVAAMMGRRDRGMDGLFDTFPAPDSRNPRAYVVMVTQSGLGLPDRDYYLRDDTTLAATREAYRKYLATMLTLAGATDAEARAGAVFDLETALAKVEWSSAARRDVDKSINPMTVSALEALTPEFSWRAYLKAFGVSPDGPHGERTLIVRENTAFPAMAKIFAATPVPVWRDWLTLHYLHNMAAYLPHAFDDADFAFYGKVLTGQEQQLPRDTRGVRLLDSRLGEPLGKLYVAKYFPPESKAKVDALVANLLAAYDADIRVIPWMTDATKEKALEKLHAFTPHIGYPDTWRDYSGLVITRGDLVGNIERSTAFELHYSLARLDQPVDRDEWDMTPPTVNAYYTRLSNAIFFPAALLQPPFFDPHADDAVNYGGIGAVIGHEIGHGFDDQGSKFDGTGMLRNWWTDADRQAFNAATAALGTQFDAYEALPGLRVNGKLTMGENVGDLSGLNIALAAYHLSLQGTSAPVLDGFTGDQRFFLGYGQVWRSKSRDERIRRQVLSDPHSPAGFRVIGPTRNTDAWHAAFGVQPGDTYYLPPDQRVRLW
jgi:putative endopeptidase